MTYNRFALAQVGGLKIIYNRRGQIIDYIGCVKGRRFSNENCTVNYNFSNSNNDNNQEILENDNYYYRTDGTKTKADNDKKVEKK